MKKPITSGESNRKIKKIKFFNNFLVILLVSLGIIMSILPVGMYFFETYSPAPHHDNLMKGSSVTYYSTSPIFSNSSSGKTYSYGYIFNVSFNGNSHQIKATEFILCSEAGHPMGIDRNDYATNAFIGQSITKISSSILTADTPLYDILSETLFPNSNHVNTTYWSYNILNKSFEGPTSNYWGNPYLYFASVPSICYMEFGHSKILSALSVSMNSSVFLNLTKQKSPDNTPTTPYSSIFSISLIYGNTLPNQNWKGWLLDGISGAFPVNIALMASGILLFIIRYRR